MNVKLLMSVNKRTIYGKQSIDGHFDSSLFIYAYKYCNNHNNINTKWWKQKTSQSFLFELIKSLTYLIRVFVITRWTTRKKEIGMAELDTSCGPPSAPLLQPTLHWHSKIKIRIKIYIRMCVFCRFYRLKFLALSYIPENRIDNIPM